MPDTVQQLVTDIRTEGGFDVPDAQALRWLNRRWRQMVGEARAYRKVVAVGNTVANQAFYAFSPVEAYSFEVAGVPYGKARRPDLYANQQGRLVWEGDGGLIVAGADANAARGITLIPVPSQAGQAITSFAAILPPELTLNPAGDALLALVLEDDFADELVAGAVATGLKRLRRRADAAVPFESEFAAGTERLRQRTKKRFRGQTPHQVRVVGLNA